jgi:hypothetical protein
MRQIVGRVRALIRSTSRRPQSKHCSNRWCNREYAHSGPCFPGRGTTA